MGKIRRLVLDVLKPHEPTIIELASQLSELAGVEAVNISSALHRRSGGRPNDHRGC
jgi:hypothetical protein